MRNKIPFSKVPVYVWTRPKSTWRDKEIKNGCFKGLVPLKMKMQSLSTQWKVR